MVMIPHELSFDVSELAIADATTAVLRGCFWESKWKHRGLHLYAISFSSVRWSEVKHRRCSVHLRRVRIPGSAILVKPSAWGVSNHPQKVSICYNSFLESWFRKAEPPIWFWHLSVYWGVLSLTACCLESADEIVASQPIHPAFEADDTGEYEEGVHVYHKLLLSPSSNSIQILPGNFQNKTLSTDRFL